MLIEERLVRHRLVFAHRSCDVRHNYHYVGGMLGLTFTGRTYGLLGTARWAGGGGGGAIRYQ